MGYLKKSQWGLVGSLTSTLVIAYVLGSEILLRGHDLSKTVFGVAALSFLLMIFFSLPTTSFIDWIKEKIGSKRIRIFGMINIFYLHWMIYALGTGELRWENWLLIFLYINLPTLVLYHRRTEDQRLNLHDIVFIILLFVPIDARVIHSLYVWPEQAGGSAYGNLLGASVAFVLASVLRNLEDIGFKLRKLEWMELGDLALHLLIFLLIAIPFGYMTDFISLTDRMPAPEKVLLNFLGIFLMVALPEELFFRGIIQNILQKTIKNRNLALTVSSLIFGLVHLNNAGVPQGPTGDYRYLVLASVAGIFYGNLYRRHRTLMPAILCHTLVDVIWVLFFRG